MAHVQRASDVWRWNDNAEHGRLRISIDLRRKIPVLLPPVVVVLLRLFGVVLFGDLHAQLCAFLRLKRKATVYARRREKFKTGPLKRLEKTAYEAQTATMTNKEIVQDLLRRIPDDASLQDIARELEFIAAVRQGLSELDNGDSIPIEEVEQELPSWIIK